MSDNTIHPCTSIIQIVIGENNEHCIFSLLSPNKNCVSTEELQCFHRVVGQGNDGVVIVDRISNTSCNVSQE
jgi:hypothetical protein